MNSYFKNILSLLFLTLCGAGLSAQPTFDDGQLGAWYMYFFNKEFGEGPWGLQGDLQYRAWDAGRDMEQLLLRGGLTYHVKEANALLTFGYANITTGAFGDSDETSGESRIYQEALLPHKLTKRVRLTHRFRYEQRWVENQDFRTRYRYNLFVNILLNADDFGKGTLHLALYNELFINGQTDIGDGREVQRFDRNRLYVGLGYGLRDNLRVQVGAMEQTTVNWSKMQTQLSLHHNF